MIRIALQNEGHRLVSAVAKPVVVVMEHIWKEATLKASGKESQVLVTQRSTVKQMIPSITAPRKTFTILVLNRFFRLAPLGQNVEKIKLKLMLANSMETLRMASTIGLSKAATLADIIPCETKPEGSLSFMVRTTTYFLPMTGRMDIAGETARLQAELAYAEGFLQNVLKKLENSRFVQNAPEQVVAMERKKKADAEAKIEALKQQIAALKA